MVRTEEPDTSSPSQALLTALYHIFPLLHPHIKTRSHSTLSNT